MKVNCAIIGSGLAGFSAAIHLKNRNKSVGIFSTGPGATSVSSGCWDFGPITSDERNSFRTLVESDTWKQLYGSFFPGNSPILGAEETCREIARALTPDLKLVAALDRAVALPNAAGEWRRTLVAQGIHGAGSLESLRGKKCLLLSARQWRFQGKRVAEALVQNAKKLGTELSLSAKEIDFGAGDSDIPLPAVAARFGADEKFRTSLTDWAIRTVRPVDASVIFLPPIFPSQKLFDQFQTKLAVPVAELLCSTEPTAGYRLFRAMEAALSRLSISKMDVTAVENIEHLDGKLEAITFRRNSGASERVEADQFLLCSGKFFGGGVHLGYQHIRETVLNLPLFMLDQSSPVQLRTETELKESPFQSTQPWSAMGVRINERWQPLDELGRPVYENLRACGSVIGGIDYAASQVGLGFMACSGREAALVVS